MDHLSFLENKRLDKAKISIIPIPFNLGGDSQNVADAPKYLLDLGFKKALESLGASLDLHQAFGAKNKVRKNNFADVANIIKKTSDIVSQKISEKYRVLGLGGDHTISIGTISGASKALRGDLGVIWIDAHADLNTSQTSLSGNLHGMASATVLGFGDSALTGLVACKIKKEHMFYIVLKDLDQAKIDLIRSQSIAAVTMMDIVENGFSSIMEHVRLLNEKVSNIWISLDVDVIDKEVAPASLMTTFGGLSYREITNLLMYLGKTSRVAGMDVVEMTPKKDVNNATGDLCLELIALAFGSRYSWYSQHMRRYNKN